MKKIQFANSNKYFTVSERVYFLVSLYDWCLDWPFGKPFSSARITTSINGKKVHLSRFITGEKDPQKYIDHIDRNPLNNEDSNLRRSTPKQSSWNRNKHKNSSSQFKGVALNNTCHRWQAYICVNGIQIFLGLFDSEVEAARAYDEAAKLHFGEFAVLNFPQEGVERAVCE